MNRIFYLMGKSASGKDTIYERLLGNQELALERIILYTTRPKRQEECEGREYYFTDDAKYCDLKAHGRVIESRSYHTVHGIWTYFTADDGQIDLERHAYLGIGTLESFARLEGHFGRERVVPLYIEVEDGERLTRALLREKRQPYPRYAEMCRRFLADEEDFSEDKLCRAGIDRRFSNQNLEECLAQIEKAIYNRL